MLDAAPGLCPKAEAVAPPLLHVGLAAMSRTDVACMASLDSMAVAVGGPSARTRFAAGGNCRRGGTNSCCFAWTMELVTKLAETLPRNSVKLLEVPVGITISSSFQRVRPSQARCCVPLLVSLDLLRVLYIPPRGSWRAGA